MRKAISRALWGAFFVGGLTVLGAGAAHAADTSGEDGIVSGNQVGILGELPVSIGGNAISVLGDSSAGTAAVTGGDGSSAGSSSTTSGENAIAGGNQVMPDIEVPVAITGNAISVVGDSTATGSQSSAPNGGTTDDAATTTGEDGIASGNQVNPTIAAPVTVGGNDISVIRAESGVDAGYFDGVLENSIVNLRILDDLLLISPVTESGPAIAPGVAESLISEPVITAPLVRGPLLRTVDVGVQSPAPTAPVAGSGATAAEGIGSGMTTMLATAALSPAVMLAATGVEALPLVGGIAFLLATGLGLMGLKRVTHTNG